MAPETLLVLALTDDQGRFADALWLARAEGVHRQLRPGLPSAYGQRLEQVCASGGRLAVAAAGEAVVGVALWRLIENTYEGRRLYVDDLVVDEAWRNQGVGKLLLEWLEGRARQAGCDVLALDSGVQRSGAHRFYFREGMHVSSFCFKKALK